MGEIEERQLLDQFFSFLEVFEDVLWGYAAVPVMMLLGLFISYKSNFIQLRKFPVVVKTFLSFFKARDQQVGVHPLKAFFACVGGCIGIGNIVGICTAVQIGGPGALFWIWITALVGMMLKYAEVYLGLRHRVANNRGGYDGGPMYYLRGVFKKVWIPNLVAVLLCIYGVEVYQFSVVAHSITNNFHINQYVVIFSLLGLVLFASSGGVRRVGSISSAIIPLFVILYMGMGSWVLLNNLAVFPEVLKEVFTSAFSGHAAVGGFAGSAFMVTVSQGVRRGCYTGDVGVGYASVIHSESSTQIPERQAALALFDIFLDTFFICSTSVLLILVTGQWKEAVEPSLLVQTVLGQYFPYMNFFMPLFLFLLGYSTINAYFCVGIKCADLLSPKYGRTIYYIYAGVTLMMTTFIGMAEAQSIMAIVNGLLLLINCYGIFRLHREISYNIDFAERKEPVLSTS